MAQSTWSYLQNPFDNVTKNSQKLMFLMATDHFDKLAAAAGNDPIIANLYGFGKPAFDAFIHQYRKTHSNDAIYQMHTQRTEDLLTQLSSTLARRWDVQIQVVFDTVTPEYKSLLPNGRGPLQVGAYDLRIDEVKALADRLTAYPALASLQFEIESFHQQLLNTRSQQQGVEHVGQVNTSEIENTRLELAKKMQAIYGALINRYYLDLSKVENFYELKYLRRSSSADNNDDQPVAVEEIIVTQSGRATAFVGKVNANSEFRLTNTGEAAITVYSAANASAPVPANGVYVISIGQVVTFKANAGDEVLVLINDTDAVDGKVLAELI